MTRIFLLLVLLPLASCTADVSGSVVEALPTLLPAPDPAVQITGSGAEFYGRFSTAGALNSKQSFLSSYHGELRVTIEPSGKIECRFWAEGRIENPTLYEGRNGFIEAFSTLCVGKLQRNGSFEFRGAYVTKDPISAEQEETDDTFTLLGALHDDRIRGSLIIGGVYATDASLQEVTDDVPTQEGLQYEIVQMQ